jgi:hypothetical protein
MDEPSSRSVSRRRLLGTGAALGTATLAGLAGCSAAEFGFAGEAGDGDPGLPEYGTWLPAPGEVFLDPEEAGADGAAVMRSYYPFRATDWTDVAARLEATGREAAGPFDAEDGDYETAYEDGHVHPVLAVGPADVGLEVRSNRGLSVLETGLEDPAIVEAFEAYEREPSRFERVGEYEGYTLLSVPGSPWTVGVRDGVVVEGFTTGMPSGPLFEEPRDVVEGIVDAREGEGRYVDADDDLDELVRRLGTGTFVTAGTRSAGIPAVAGNATDGGTATPTPEPGPVATGTGTTIDDGTATLRYVAVFGSASAASVEVLARNGSPWSDWEGVETSTDGRAVVVEGTRESRTFLEG